MDIIKLEEAGYESALYGLSTSFMTEGTGYFEWWTPEKREQMARLAKKQAHMDGGHNKFLEHMMTWWRIRAPRGWWQEADTYRLESKQSASTMHTIQRRELLPSDFAPDTPLTVIHATNDVLREVTENFTKTGRLAGRELETVKWALPEGFLQTREWRLSYKTLRNIILQRRTHRLRLWQEFILEVRSQVNHPDLLPSLDIS